MKKKLIYTIAGAIIALTILAASTPLSTKVWIGIRDQIGSNGNWDKLILNEVSAPGAVTDTGQWYVATDNSVHYLSETGTDTQVVNDSGVAGGGGSGDVTAAASFGTDDKLITSDGTGKGVQSSDVTVIGDDISNVGTLTTTVEIRTPSVVSTAADGLHGYGGVNTIDYAGSKGEGWHYYQSTLDLFLRKKDDGTFEEEVGTNTSAVVINKTIDADNNTISNIGSTEITNDSIVNADINSSAAIVGSKLQAASLTNSGAVELATAAEINIGTDAGRAMGVNEYVVSNFAERAVQMVIIDFGTDTNMTVANGKFYYHIDSRLGGMNLVDVHAEVITAGTTGTLTCMVHNVTQAADMLSTGVSVDTGETGSDQSATPAVIDTGNDDVAENDLIRIDIDDVHTTAAKGLILTNGYRWP